MLLWPLLAGLLLATLDVAQAARRDFYFEELSVHNGLAQNTVTDLLQDHDGYVWIATQGGLHRYDGQDFRVFLHDPDQRDSLPDSFITAIAEGDGRLWVGSSTGYVASLDLTSGKARRLPAAAIPKSGTNAAQVFDIAVAADGMLWIATAEGVHRLDPRSGTRQPRLTLPPGQVANALLLDADGTLWAGTGAGLYRLPAAGGEAEHVPSPERVHSLFRDRQGQLWFGADGLYRYDPAQRRSVRFWAPAGRMAPTVVDIEQDHDGRLWLALLGEGLVRLEPATGKAMRIRETVGMPAGLPEDAVMRLLVDRSGLLWVGSFTRGVAVTAPGGARFDYLVDLAADGHLVAGNSVRALQQDAAGRLWIGSDRGGLKRYDPVTGRYERFNKTLLAAATPSLDSRGLAITSIIPWSDGGLWLGSNRGLLRLGADGTSASMPLRVAPNDPTALPTASVRTLLGDRRDGLWIGTSYSGLFHYIPASGALRHYPSVPGDPASLSHGFVHVLLQDADGTLWIGTDAGLNRLDPATGSIQRYTHLAGDPHSLPDARVRALHRDGKGRLWLGTHSGLVQATTQADGQLRFELYTPTHSRTGSGFIVFGILPSADGALWLSSSDGVQRFDPERNQFRRYMRRDGLQDLEFNGGAALQLSDGRLAFGGIRGVNVFDPTAMADSDFAPPPTLLAVRAGSDPRNLVGLHAPSSLRVPQQSRALRLRFGALDYAAPGQLRYRYRMDGFDTDWIDAGNQPEATYTNLDSGNYLFRVRASNRDGVWSTHELRLPITITPPWWNSHAAQAAYALLLALIVFCIWRTRHRRRAQERAMNAEIREREERLKLALWGSGDSFWDWDIGSNRLSRDNADWLVGNPELRTVTSEQWLQDGIHPDDLAPVLQRVQDHLGGKTAAFESEHRIRGAGGQWIWVRSRGKVAERDAAGRPVRMSGTARNVSASRAADRQQRIASEVLRSMNESVAVFSLDYRFISVNPAFSKVTGYAPDEAVGQPTSLIDSPRQRPEFYQQMRKLLENTGHWAGEMWQRRKDGDEFLGALKMSEIRDAEGSRSHFVCVVNDITDSKRAEQELRYLANYDTLTGLPNRALLSERLARAIVRARRHDTRVAVLFLDLDRFKDINDSLGHAVGDRILKAAAARLQATIRNTDTVARLGGDEFTVVLEDVEDIAAVERIARQIIHAFEAPLQIDDPQDVSISPSIGISLYPDHGQVPTDLLKFADTAMYQAKAGGRNMYQMYTEAMDAQTRRRASISGALRKALDRGELRLLYQPRMSLLDGRITGTEALLRWHSEELGDIPPSVFIPLAEENGLILPIGEWVLREACTTLHHWRQHGMHEIAMAINVSVLQLLRGRLQERLPRILAETGAPADCIELEVTESMVMANAEQTTAVLHALRALGVSLAIDDFGTGYSSLVYLKRLPINTLKIDQEFVRDLTIDPDDEAITATVIRMGQSLGLNVIAEGVETEQQLAYLREQGCDEIQGYWLSPALAPDQCLSFMRTWRPETVARIPRVG